MVTKYFRIKMFGSTDVGGSFLINHPKASVFHAGDLNWWHWAGEGDSDNLAARDEYFKELERIPRVSMNIVFFPVDARQAVAREWGVKAFLEKFDVSTALVPMPMHLESVGRRLTNSAGDFPIFPYGYRRRRAMFMWEK